MEMHDNNNEGQLRDETPVEQVRQLLGDGKQVLSIPGCPRLTKATNALIPGALTVVAGPPGAGKGFFTIRTLYERFCEGQAVQLLPLEDTRADILHRTLAIAANTWVVMESDAAGRERRERLLEQHATNLSAFGQHVMENPRLQLHIEKGILRIPPLPPEAVLSRVAESARPEGLILIDPLSQIDFVHYRQQETFVRGLLAILARTQSMAILVAHLTKQPRRAYHTYQLHDLQGAAGIGRLCHTALALASHERRRSLVYRENGATDEIEHDKTLSILKARNGRGGGLQLAYRSRPTSPLMDEMGILIPETQVEELRQKAIRGSHVRLPVAAPVIGARKARGA